MRTLLIAGTAMIALFGVDSSAAQRMVQRGPGAVPNATRVAPRAGMPQVGQHRAPRWGSKVGGRWWGGVNAPGGWNAYRRQVRGSAVPVYWNTPRFYVSDWSSYGLARPRYGYNWVRYYDDAVLVDSRGSVYDTAGDVDWDRYDRAADGYRDDDRVYAGNERGEDYGRDVHHEGGYERRDDGREGAVVGAVAGGVAGNLIAGRGDRLGGTLIGAGVGAAAGYAIDRNEDRRRRGPPPPPHRGVDYGAGYPQPSPQFGYAPPPLLPPMLGQTASGGSWISPDGGTTVVSSGGGFGGSFTTVTVQTAPVVTTTTTEIYEDHVTWSRPVAKRKVWKPRRKVNCYCK